MSHHAHTIGILYPGEMGASLAGVLASRGYAVVTTLADRGEATARRSEAAGVIALGSLEAVAGVADVVLSVVPPGDAEAVAGAYLAVSNGAPAGAIYVDVNSIGPELAMSLAARFEARGRAFVDAAINGLAANLTTTATLFLSGAGAGEVAELFGDALRVQHLGSEAGRASAMKMLLSGVSKGVCAMFVELALVAHRHDMLAEMTEAYARIYPGVMALVDRMMPTYPLHAGRRAVEMRELELTARAVGIEPTVVSAIRKMHDMLANVNFGGAETAWTTNSVIEHLAATLATDRT